MRGGDRSGLQAPKHYADPLSLLQDMKNVGCVKRRTIKSAAELLRWKSSASLCPADDIQKTGEIDRGATGHSSLERQRGERGRSNEKHTAPGTRSSQGQGRKSQPRRADLMIGRAALGEILWAGREQVTPSSSLCADSGAVSDSQPNILTAGMANSYLPQHSGQSKASMSEGLLCSNSATSCDQPDFRHSYYSRENGVSATPHLLQTSSHFIPSPSIQRHREKMPQEWQQSLSCGRVGLQGNRHSALHSAGERRFMEFGADCLANRIPFSENGHDRPLGGATSGLLEEMEHSSFWELECPVGQECNEKSVLPRGKCTLGVAAPLPAFPMSPVSPAVIARRHSWLPPETRFHVESALEHGSADDWSLRIDEESFADGRPAEHDELFRRPLGQSDASNPRSITPVHAHTSPDCFHSIPSHSKLAAGRRSEDRPLPGGACFNRNRTGTYIASDMRVGPANFGGIGHEMGSHRNQVWGESFDNSKSFQLDSSLRSSVQSPTRRESEHRFAPNTTTSSWEAPTFEDPWATDMPLGVSDHLEDGRPRESPDTNNIYKRGVADHKTWSTDLFCRVASPKECDSPEVGMPGDMPRRSHQDIVNLQSSPRIRQEGPTPAGPRAFWENFSC